MAEPGDDPAEECTLFSRYLGAGAPTAYVRERYARARALRGRQPAPGSLDARLLAFARRGPGATRVADAFARFGAPTCELRRRLVLLLAILESTPAAEDLDRVAPRAPAAALFGLAPRLALAALSLGAGLVLFGPRRLFEGARAGRGA